MLAPMSAERLSAWSSICLVVRELDSRRTTGLDEQIHECRDGFLARPVALQLAQQLRHADSLPPACSMRRRADS